MSHLRRLLASLKRSWKELPEQRIIGEAIRKHRKSAEMSQEKLAEKADLHPVYLGQALPTLIRLGALLDDSRQFVVESIAMR